MRSIAEAILQEHYDAITLMVTTMGRSEVQATLLLPVGECRRELMRPVDATAIDDHDHGFAGMAKERHDLLEIVPKPLGIKMRNDFIEDVRGAIWLSLIHI